MLKASAVQRLARLCKRNTQWWLLALIQITVQVGRYFAETPLTIHIVRNVKHPTVFSGVANEKPRVSCVKETSV